MQVKTREAKRRIKMNGQKRKTKCKIYESTKEEE